MGFVVTIFLFLGLLAVFPESTSPIPSVVHNIFKDILGPVAAGFGGALLGAFSTYAIQSNTERRKEKISFIKSYNEGLTILTMKYKDLWSIKQQVIVPCQNEPLRFMRMPRFQEYLSSDDRAIDALSQIIINAGMGDLLSKLLVAEKKYTAALASFGERNDLLLQYVAELDGYYAKTKGRQRPTLADLVLIHSHTRILRLYDFSEGVIRNLDDAIASLYHIINHLRTTLPAKIEFEKYPLIDVKVEVSEKTPPPHYLNLDALSSALDEAIKAR